LDVDDVDSFGPETITINQNLVGKKYLYAVHNFSNGSNPNSSALSNSGATVNVYIGQTLVRTYHAIPQKVGNIWMVFGIDENGAFQDINTYTGTSNSSDGVISILGDMVGTGDFQVSNNASRADLSQAEALNLQGEQQYHQGNLEDAMYLFQDAINISSNYGQAYSNLGLTYQKLGREAEALWANRKAIELANGSTKNTVQASSYYNIAKIYESKSQWQEALNNYQNALTKKEHPAYRKGVARMQVKLR
jgi:tetratricopeptide (TPR) repeat protein